MFKVYRFCRCFLIFNPVVFCVDDGVILWLKIKNPTATTICYSITGTLRLVIGLYTLSLSFTKKHNVGISTGIHKNTFVLLLILRFPVSRDLLFLSIFATTLLHAFCKFDDLPEILGSFPSFIMIVHKVQTNVSRFICVQ